MNPSEWRRRLYHRTFSADRVLRRIVGADTRVADVGCSTGTGSAVLDLHGQVTGVDIHLRSLRIAVASGRRGHAVNADITRLPFAVEAFDVVVALDVVEHLERSDGMRLLAELTRIGRCAVVLTPSGFDPQPSEPDQPWMEHRSGWSARDLREAGYEVHGAGGPRWLRHPGGAGRFRFGVAGALLGAVLARPFQRWPDRSFHLLAISHSLGARPSSDEPPGTTAR